MDKVILSSLLFITFSLTAVGISAECLNDTESVACQQPYFADNQSEYLYDLTASWSLNAGSAPDGSGPAIFYGGKAGDINEGLESDDVDSGEKEQFYIEDPGKAEGGDQSQWGRGELRSENLVISGAKKGEGDFGEFLIDPPYEGQCGDGFGILSSDMTGSEECPEDLGLPSKIEIEGFDPTENDIFFHGCDEEIPDQHLWFEGSQDAQSWHCSASYGGSEYYHSDNYIFERTPSPNTETIYESTHHKLVDSIQDATENPSESQREVCSPSSNCTNSMGTICTSVTSHSDVADPESLDLPIIDVTADFQSYDIEEGLFGEEYDEGDLEAQISYADYGRYTTAYTCDSTDEIYTECEDGKECSFSSETLYGNPNDFDDSFDITSQQDFSATYESFSTTTSTQWGPVNQEIDFGNLPSGGSIDNVHESSGGYHAYGEPQEVSGSIPGSQEASSVSASDDVHGSNSPSVSFNEYELIAEDGAFWAERTNVEVSNPDGPDGQSSAIVAYNEVEGEGEIKGTNPDSFLDTSVVNGETDPSLIDESEVKDKLSCPGDSIRCIASIDIQSKDQGWQDPQDSYEINVVG